MRPIRLVAVTVLLLVGACGDDAGLSDYYPELPPTGSQGASAGEVTSLDQLVTGPGQSGVLGDFYIKNDVVTIIVQAPTRAIGVIPQGGNVIDAVLTDGTRQLVDDHFGELALIYKLGRTCEPDRMEIVRDGSRGGPAVLRAIGSSGNNDFINIKGIGVFRVDPTVDPDIPDGVECATTYILEPGSRTLEVHHSLFNEGPDAVNGPLGTIADIGGHTDAWTNSRGFERADISAITTLSKPSPIDFVIYQGPNVAYGIIPRHDEPTSHTQALIAGVSIMLDGNDKLLDILDEETYFLRMKKGSGKLQSYDLVVGKDASDVDAVYREGEALADLSGTVMYSNGQPAVGARVGVFVDGNGNGTLEPSEIDDDDNGVPDDKVISYLDVDATGRYAGKIATTAGNLLVRAWVKNVGISQVAPAAASVNLAIPAPIKVDYQILDFETNAPVPGRLLVIGDHPAFPDSRVFETSDRLDDVVQNAHSIRGTTTDIGDGADAPLVLPANGSYRVYASRGTEWSIDSQALNSTTDASLQFTLRQVNPSAGYVSSDWHVHQVGSPDSNVPSDERVRSAVSSGTEVIAVTDHDYVADLQPLVEQTGLAALLRVFPGIEVTPFAHGHFNAWPIEPDNTSSNKGAIDWARGREGFAMVPGEIFAAMRERGARLVQVNHPREVGFTEFQGAWSRANVKFDYANRTIFGDYEGASTPNDWLRVPGESLWSDQFSALEVWNGFQIVDSNGDGVRENQKLDRVMRDWLAMLSLGMFVTPTGNSDTHYAISDPVGMPRTYVRVTDDSPNALSSGAIVEDILTTQTGASSRPRDLLITNGPFLDVRVNNMPALGSVIAANGGVTIEVTMTSPDWAEFDTLEVFANTTPDALRNANEESTLVPLKCWTSRTLGTLMATDPCMRATLAPESMNVQLRNLSGGGGFERYEANVTITLDADDIVTRAGRTGTDAFLVFRVRGDRAIFPLLTGAGAIDATTRPLIMSGNPTQLRTALVGKGVFAQAFTSPMFVDFDGGGYRAPFAP
ncbi:MAG: CehA/McbA family metallohydrolase [Kofleriaceae bacterium]